MISGKKAPIQNLFDLVAQAITRYNSFVVFYLIAVNGLYLVILMVSLFELIRFKRTQSLVDEAYLMQSDETPSISVISPAYNEEATIIEAVNALLKLHYPRFEIIVVNDGSKDNTLNLLIDKFQLRRIDCAYTPVIPTKPVRNIYMSPAHPRLRVVDKENGGKADSLNTGINVSRNELFCGIDADSLLEADALLKGVYPFARWKGDVAVTSGIIRIVNGCTVNRGKVEKVALPKMPVVLFQIVEYLRIFLIGRFAWNAMNSVLIVSGAFGIFKKDLVISAGGYMTNTVGEDMELIVRIHRVMRERKKVERIYFLDHPVCWTEAPSSLRVLARQRDRWQRGLMETLWKHRAMIGNPRYGTIGMFSIPFIVAFEMLSPLVEMTGYATMTLSFAMGMLETHFVVLFLVATFLFGHLMSICSLIIEEALFKKYGRLRDILILIVYAFLENLGWRQIHFLIRFKALFSFLSKKKGWGAMTRAGFGPVKPAAQRVKG